MRALIVYEVSATPRTGTRDSARKYGRELGGRELAIPWLGDYVHELLADRFVPLGQEWIDLASGAPVRVRLASAGDRSAQAAWNDRCGELARLRHPMINSLVDFGLASNDRTFEAYGIRGLMRSSGAAGSLMLTHAVRFIASRGIPLTRDVAHAVVRDVTIGTPPPGRRRPLGVVLQPRLVLDGFSEALDSASPGGAASIQVRGGAGCGLRTIRTLACRAARLAGYIPVSSGVLLRLQSLHDCLWERHLCVVLEDSHTAREHEPLAVFLARLSTRSARRHVVVKFVRTENRSPGALEVEPMDASALTAMVFIDHDCGPTPDELVDAVREAAGRPGAFLERLRAASFEDHVPRMALVHESSPAYVLRSPLTSEPRPSRGVGRALRDAPERAVRLAARGRHASAVRLLTRASRVLEARGELVMASACTEALAWIERDRGRSDRALEGFERARTLAGDGAGGVHAAIGSGVVWTDQQRFVEAEAALRGAVTAAEVLGCSAVRSRSVRALARCLYWQARHEEAEVALAPLLGELPSTAGGVEAWALGARNDLASANLRRAVARAAEAARAAERLIGEPSRLTAIKEHRSMAAAARAMALVQIALGDGDRARHWIARGLASASAAHLPLTGLRLRALSSRADGLGGDRAGLERSETAAERLRAALSQRPLPILLRAELESLCGPRASTLPVLHAPADEGSMADLQLFLELAQRAGDDHTALEEVCRALVDRLRAATVQIAGDAKEPRTLARAGRPWQGDSRLIERLLAGGAPIADEPCQAGEPVRYGGEPIAVLCCRWTMGAGVEPRRTAALLRAGALAAAGPVRSLLDRSHAPAPNGAWSDLIGAGSAAAGLREAIARAARAPFPVLVEGESGSGKELVARGIHRLSSRRDRRLCTVNCAALSEDLLEAELFGHARGAFTGAVGERPGLFEEADGGTLFLDEVGELSPRAQAKLLRVLQDGEVRRVGENMPRRVDARIVAATNRRLQEEVTANRFRADLRFRLDVVRISVPPLRERATDIPALAVHFWTEATARVGSSATLTAETLAALARYDWPGNVRELQNAVASMAVHAPRRGRITPSMLPAHIARATPSAATFEAARHEFERRYVRAALAEAGGQRARAARVLGISRQGLAKMMRRLCITD
jgi:DNA-binding NtrC family response regulator/tetratricopeptide (TPR) repeat protein